MVLGFFHSSAENPDSQGYDIIRLNEVQFNVEIVNHLELLVGVISDRCIALFPLRFNTWGSYEFCEASWGRTGAN